MLVQEAALVAPNLSDLEHLDIADNLLPFYQERMSKNSTVADLEIAIGARQEEICLGPLIKSNDDHPATPRLLVALAQRARDECLKTGPRQDMEHVIEWGRRAVSIVPEENQSDRVTVLSELGMTLHGLFTQTEEVPHLEEAIRTFQQAEAITPENHPLAGLLGNSLSSALGDRYLRMGTMGDLDEAIRLGRNATAIISERRPTLAQFFNNTTQKLEGQLSKRLNDLEKSIQSRRRIISAIPKVHTDRLRLTNNLGLRLGDQFPWISIQPELDEAGHVARQASLETAEGHANPVEVLTNLGIQLNRRYLCTGAPSDLEEAVHVRRQAVASVPEGHSDESRLLNLLGVSLRMQFKLAGRVSDIEESIRILALAVDINPDEHADSLRLLLNYAYSLRDLGSVGYHNTDPKELTRLQKQAIPAIPSFCSNQAAAHQPNVATPYQIFATRYQMFAARMSAHDRSYWQRAYESAKLVISQITGLVSNSLNDARDQDALKEVTTLSSDAAAAALQAGQDPMVALSLLEQGRGILGVSVEDVRSSMLDLQVQHAQLAADLSRLSNELYQPANDARPRTKSRPYDAEQEFDDLVLKIRELPGFENFFRPLSAEDIHAAADDGPLALVNVSNTRCDALLIEQHQIHVLPLTKVSRADVEDKLGSSDLESPEILEWLWDCFAEPILDALGLTQPLSDDNQSRMCWILPGNLSLFPLQASGHHLKQTSETVRGRVISSYTTSINSIARARRRQDELE